MLVPFITHHRPSWVHIHLTCWFLGCWACCRCFGLSGNGSAHWKPKSSHPMSSGGLWAYCDLLGWKEALEASVHKPTVYQRSRREALKHNPRVKADCFLCWRVLGSLQIGSANYCAHFSVANVHSSLRAWSRVTKAFLLIPQLYNG